MKVLYAELAGMGVAFAVIGYSPYQNLRAGVGGVPALAHDPTACPFPANERSLDGPTVAEHDEIGDQARPAGEIRELNDVARLMQDGPGRRRPFL